MKAETELLKRLAKLVGIQKSLDELSTADYDAIADALVAAADDGEIWAIQEVARAIDG